MVALSVLMATAPTDNPVNASMFTWLFTTFMDAIENAGNCAVGTLPSDPKLATPFSSPMRLLLIFVFNAVCVKVLIGLLASLVLSIFSMLKLVLNSARFEVPVPPFAIETIPVTLVALPIIFALNAPLLSRLTILLAKLLLVALFANVIPVIISSAVFPPILNTNGVVAVPPKSPANKILPLLVVVASATEFVIEPEASDNAFATYSVVANLVELSFNASVMPLVVEGKTTLPVNMGDIKLAFRSNAVSCAVLTGLFASDVLSIFESPKLDFALSAEFAPVPPFVNATIPVMFVAFPVNVPVTLPVILPITFPVTLPMILPLKVLAVMVLPEKSPIGLLLTI